MKKPKNKYQDDPLYILKLEYARKAHDYIEKSRFIRTEEANDHPDAYFKVYEFLDECYRVEMKVKCKADGMYLYILRIYKK